MSFEIGFTSETEKKEQFVSQEKAYNKEARNALRKSVVDVFFPDRHLTCAYYNDQFNLKRGDIVYVDGKLKGMQGRVVGVNYTFKIKLSDYKRVIGVADTNVSGKLFMAGSHFIAIDRSVIPFEKIITWFKAPEPEEEEFVSSADDETFNLDDLSGMKIKNEIAELGHEYYMENRVVYIEINDGKARAIANGSKPYEVEFDYHNRNISNLVCNCYCTGTCKHEFATMLQFRETLKVIDEEYGDAYTEDLDYLAIISKPAFFEYVIDSKTNGSIELN